MAKVRDPKKAIMADLRSQTTSARLQSPHLEMVTIVMLYGLFSYKWTRIAAGNFPNPNFPPHSSTAITQPSIRIPSR